MWLTEVNIFDLLIFGTLFIFREFIFAHLGYMVSPQIQKPYSVILKRIWCLEYNSSRYHTDQQ